MVESLNTLGIDYVVQHSDYLTMSQRIFKSLLSLGLPSIRANLQKRGISVIQNTYTGFDTEYHLLDQNSSLNKLFSLQMVKNTRLIIKVPNYTRYRFSHVQPLTTEISLQSPGKSMELVEDSIDLCIDDIRSLKYKENVDIIDCLKTILQEHTQDLNIISFEDESYCVFAFPRSNFIKYIYFNENNRGFKFTEMVKNSNQLAKSSHQYVYSQFIQFW
jgi:hypothetical protein